MYVCERERESEFIFSWAERVGFLSDLGGFFRRLMVALLLLVVYYLNGKLEGC